MIDSGAGGHARARAKPRQASPGWATLRPGRAGLGRAEPRRAEPRRAGLRRAGLRRAGPGRA
ncbi:hypothetical protein AADW15_38720, partial [Saccharothrix sp. CCNWLY140-2]